MTIFFLLQYLGFCAIPEVMESQLVLSWKSAWEETLCAPLQKGYTTTIANYIAVVRLVINYWPFVESSVSRSLLV